MEISPRPFKLNLFFEDFSAGRDFVSSEKIVVQEDIRKFANLTGDSNKLHLEEEYAKSTIFGRPIAHGMFVLSLALGLWYSMDLTRESIIAFLGIDHASFRLPVYAGDRIHLTSKVLSSRESRSQNKAGIVVFKDEMRNSRGESVLDFERALLLKKRQNDI